VGETKHASLTASGMGEISPENPEGGARQLVSRIYDAILKEDCVVFLGAGSTTEGRRQEGKTFYHHIKGLCEFHGVDHSFPELMQYFCDQMDGGRHNRLIREALSRIELFCLRGEDNYFATIFTNSIAEIPYFKTFITTNWDPFLERSLDVLVPMVEDRDLAFWDDHKRQVLKIHGCISRPYSIVATQTDYDNCMTLRPLIFNKMRDLMATKSFLFVGYSMRDPDFEKVWSSICGSLGHFTHMAYALDPNASSDKISSWKGRGIQIFKTTDSAFLQALRERLEKAELLPTESFVRFLRRERRRITSTHLKMGQTSVGRFSSAMYQDGLLHELESILTSSSLGTRKKKDFENDHGEALKYLQEMRRANEVVEIAYWSGRAEVLERFNKRDRTAIPTYFHPDRLHPTQKLVKGQRF
jgi:hypothetical protein